MAAAAASSARWPLRAAMLETLIGLLAVTGLRVGEALRLEPRRRRLRRRRDHGSGHQVRQVAPGPGAADSTIDASAAYAERRDRSSAGDEHRRSSCPGRGISVAYTDFGVAFRRAIDAAGIGAGSPARPRIHDLRHTLRGAHPARLVPRRRRRRSPAAAACRPTSVTANPRSTYWYLSAAPELLAPRRRPARSTPQAVRGHDPDRADPAGLLHRPAHPATPGQPATSRGLPRHPATAARASSPPADRQDCPAQLDWDDLDAPVDHRVPATTSRSTGTTAPGPATLRLDRDPLAVLLRRAAPPRTRRCSSSECWPSPRNGSTRRIVDVPHRHRGRRPPRRARPTRWEGRRDRALLAARRPDRPARLRAHRPQLRRRHPRQPAPTSAATAKAANNEPSRSPPAPSSRAAGLARANEPGAPTTRCSRTRTGRRLSRDAVERRVSTHAATAAQRCPSLRGKPHPPPRAAPQLRHGTAPGRRRHLRDRPLARPRRTSDPPHAYLHADITIKERALARTTPNGAKPGRYRPPDTLLAFLESL